MIHVHAAAGKSTSIAAAGGRNQIPAPSWPDIWILWTEQIRDSFPGNISKKLFAQICFHSSDKLRHVGCISSSGA